MATLAHSTAEFIHRFKCAGSIRLWDHGSKLYIFRLSIGMVTTVVAVARTIHKMFESFESLMKTNHEICNRHLQTYTKNVSKANNRESNVGGERVLHKSFTLKRMKNGGVTVACTQQMWNQTNKWMYFVELSIVHNTHILYNINTLVPYRV